MGNTLQVRFQFRRDTSANWTAANPVLADGEIGLEIDTRHQRVGDGTRHWNDLPVAVLSAGWADLLDKPTTFPPQAHGHAQSDITGLSTALSAKVDGTDSRLSDARPASDVPAWAKAASKPAYTPGEVGADAAGAAAAVTLAGLGGVATGDSRLSDARSASDVSVWAKAGAKPTYTAAEVSADAAGAAATVAGNLTTHGNLTTTAHGGIVASTDSRLSDARTPVAHNQASSTITAAFATLSAGATAMAFGTNDAVKVTPNAGATYTTTVPAAGKHVVLIILTSGTTSYTITFGTGFKPTGTLATGTTTARVFCIHWISDGTNLYEAGRTAAMVA